ncbi:MAG: outer membrane protein transport protein [Candidatus Aminicenantes bacterium]|nr:outer membrane protein transport protein [Candidatus Aminicenantes bacterium]
MKKVEGPLLSRLPSRRLWLAAGLLLFPSLVRGGSWNNILVSTRPAGMGGAFAAVPGDPSGIFFNPAGLAGTRSAWIVDVEGCYVRPDHSYRVPGRPEAASRRSGVLPQGFAVFRATQRLSIGFGVFLVYAAGGVDWKLEDTGLPLKSVMGIYSFSSAIAYRVSESLSAGFALNVYRTRLSVTAEMDPFGLVENNETGGAVSASFGLMARPLSGLSLGLCLKGPAEMKTSGQTSVDLGVFTFRFPSETSFPLPWDIEAGFSYRAAGRFLVAVSAEYALWSSLKTLDKVFKDVPLMGDVAVSSAMNYRNILILRAGMEWALSPAFQARAGFTWDPAAAPEESLNLGNIDVDKRTLSLGASWRAGRTQIDIACGYAFGAPRQKRTEEAGSETIETYDLDVFFLGVGFRFMRD